ncbi:hypothetical protein LINGRAHAP2_LOCUS7427 [Linum grandiflorum]
MQVCLQTTLDEAEWILDSGCSHHMTGNMSLFYSFQSKEKGKIPMSLPFHSCPQKNRNIILVETQLI